jgi:hypothetical protein
MKKVWIITAIILASLGSYLGWRSVPRQYGWLTFGPNVQLRMLLRVDRETVSIDLNRNGKFERTEQVPIGALKDHPLMISEGKVSYVITKITEYSWANGPRDAMVYVDVKGPLEFQQMADVMLSRTRRGASVAHFNGPLAVQAQTILWELPPDLALRRGDKPTDIRVNIGTYRKADRCWTAVCTQDKTNSVFPAGVFPTVEVEFAAAPGKSPVTARYALDKVC